LWVEALIGVPTVSRGQWPRLPWLLRWLIATRAAVLPLTLFAVLFAWCLAWPRTAAAWLIGLVVMAALLLAHATNNLLNDYVDYRRGLDRDDYFRARYGVHLLASGLCDERTFLKLLWVTGTAALLLGLGVCFHVGGWSYWFAGAGACLVLSYTYPLKPWAMGELAILCAWGPLMVGGTYLCLTGSISADILLAGVVYGLGPTAVIFAKHTDKSLQDSGRGVLTLPVVIHARGGEKGEVFARQLIAALAVVQIASAVGVGLFYGYLGLLGVLLGLPALCGLMRVTAHPRPAECPEDYPQQAWPLWYTTHAFVYARNAGVGLLLGVLLQRLLT
jgi:1,4-dihydroxy-2-naphthoate octaprenyltransferase